MVKDAHCSDCPSVTGKGENVDFLRRICGVSVTRDERYPRRGRWVAHVRLEDSGNFKVPKSG